MEKQEAKQPELQDLLLAVKRWLAVNKQNVTFIYSFMAYKKDEENTYCDCGESCDCVDYNKSTLGVFGYLSEARNAIELLRDMVEDESDEDGFINIIE